jgi:PiT family inorganic phosphate transporter
MAVLHQYDWILAPIASFFYASSFSIGANYVANSYAKLVAVRMIPMWVAGILAACTEIIGAVAMGKRFSQTIKSGIINVTRFEGRLGVFMLCHGICGGRLCCMACNCYSVPFPVSTTQTIVGALIGVGSASQTSIYWGRQKDSVSQVAASWGIAPAIAGGFASVILLTIKVLILWRNDLLKWGLCAITVYMAATAAVLAVFIIDSVPSSSLEKLGTKSVNVALGV